MTVPTDEFPINNSLRFVGYSFEPEAVDDSAIFASLSRAVAGIWGGRGDSGRFGRPLKNNLRRM